ncbi:protein CONSERVED ONLY IN THE GREEN LINEAGE 160, chloroplastic-like isoform X2 [Apium graveolens]|uniref:protein CONSERVED ONLY IN THE GREEN LINEAGE 160, chloroplastic-like isoform X2 n=1 Tax=Apium graveolens TaxID=4045 RepID=UPI003D78ECA2
MLVQFQISNSGDLKQKWRPAPTRCGQDKWDRAYKAVTGGSEFMLREIKKPVGDPEVLAAESREQYLKGIEEGWYDGGSISFAVLIIFVTGSH